MNPILFILGKLIIFISKLLNLGNGSTWPGHVALSVNKDFIKDVLNSNPQLKTILIAGTNGKTTTSKLIRTILENNEIRVIHNESGANLINGIASVLIQNVSAFGKTNASYAIFEIDENTLPLILKEINNPDFILILNLFRDQLDRYGEVNTIAAKWKSALEKLTSETTLILNADDPQIAYLASHLKGVNVKYFGINSKNKTDKHQHASDSTYCPNCGEKLIYNAVYFSHLGDWHCKKCDLKHPPKIFTDSPIYPLVGMYNDYNTNAAVLLAKQIGIDEKIIKNALQNFKPAFGRQEDLEIDGKKVKIFLSKNPTSFNESLRTIASLRAKNLLIVLNDRIPDGRDVSWIWDIDIEEYIKGFNEIIISGDRAFDMGLRIKYSSKLQITNFKFQIEEDLKKAIALSLRKTPKSETLYILPTYSAMLEVRKILTGKKIL